MATVHCCGEPLHCPGFTNTCPHCGADYNWAGQLLASRGQWGEETEETYEDLQDIDTADPEELLRGRE